MKIKYLIACVLFVIALFAIPETMNYQGKLTSLDGVAFEGVLTVTFSIYDVETSGFPLWTENQDVTFVKGLFDVQLGSMVPLSDFLDFSDEYFIEIAIGGDVLNPRQPLTTVPYAFRAAIADSVVGGGGGGNNLDEAYDASPSGSKRIDADDGAVEIVSGLFNSPLSVTSNSIADAAIYATNAPGGNAIWADENIFANNANIIAKGDVRVEDASGYTAGLVGGSGNLWLHGRIEMNNDRTIFARNSTGDLKGILTPLNGADDVILSMADGNNFYIQDNTYSNVAQFAGGDVALYLFGDLSVSDALYIGDVPQDMTADSVLTIDGGQVKKVAASSLSGADSDWQIGSGIIYNMTDNVGIGTSTPSSKLTAVNDFGSSDGIVVKVDASGGSGMEYPVIYGINSDVNMTSNGSGIGVYGRGHGGTAAIVGIGLWGSAYSTSVSSNLKGVIGQIETGSVPAPAAAIYGVVGDVGVAYNGPWSGFFTGAPVRIPNMSVPSATDDGAIYYDTDDNKMYYYDGSTWVEMGSDNDWAYSSGSGLTGDIYHTGNIGIGTTSPSYKLDVAGYLRVNSTSYPGRDYRIQCGSRQQIYASNDLVEYVDGNKDVIVGVTGPNNDFYICSGTEGSKFFTAEGTNQRIGIGTISPSQKLDVNGNVKVGDALYVGSVPDDAVADSVLTIDGGQVKKIATSSISGADADWQIGSGIIYNTTDDVGIGTSSPEYELDIRESMGIATTDEANFLTISALPSNGPTLRFNSDDDLIFASGLIYSGVSSSTERMRLTGDGNLGIGSDAPLSILSVNGDGYSSAALYSGDDGYTYAARFDGTVIAEDGGLFQAHLLSGNYAVYARIGSATATDKRAVYGLADGGNGTKYGGYFATTNTGNNYGVFGRASSGTISYGGAFEARIASNQNIGIFASDQNPPVYPFGSGISYAGWFDGDVMTTDRTYFGDSDVYIRQDGSNNMVLRDPNTNGGSEVTLSDLYSGGAFIQNQSSSWQDGWFQIQKEITTTQDAIAEIDFSADITGGYGSAYGVNVTSDTLQDKGVMIGVLASTAIAPVGHLQSGRASGRLAYVTGYDSSGRMVGVDGYSYPAVLDNFDGTTICAGIGVRGNVTPPTVLTLDATGTYWIGGVYGAVNGAINTTPANGAVAGVIGVDNNSGTATSYAGYFDGDVNITGSLTGADVHIGSGASGYITKWTGAYSQGNSQIYDNGSNVGIGTSSPSTKLHVQTSGGGEIARFSSYSYSGPTAIIGTENTAPGLGYLGLYYATESTPRVKITAHASNPSYFNGGGNVGIGTTTPSQKLDVNGYVDMANGYAIGASATNIKITYGRITYGNLSNNARYWATIPHGLSNAYQVLASLYNCADGSSQVHPAGVSVSVFRSGGSGAWSYCIENKSGGTRNISITWMAIGAP